MDTTFDILQAIGLGLAFGLRPVVAPLIVAICAAVGLGIDLDGTVVADLAKTPELAALAVFAVAWIGLEITRGATNQLVHLLIAALFAGAFGAGSVDEHSSAWWPGVVAGVLAAALAWAALTPLLAGARQRLAGEKEAGIILPARRVDGRRHRVPQPRLPAARRRRTDRRARPARPWSQDSGGRYAGLRTLTK